MEPKKRKGLGEDLAIGQRIKERRTYLKLTEEELASRTGMTRSRIANYINAHSRVPGPEVVRIAKALGVSCDWILTGDEFDGDARPYEVATKADIARLSEQLLKMAKAQA